MEEGAEGGGGEEGHEAGSCICSLAYLLERLFGNQSKKGDEQNKAVQNNAEHDREERPPVAQHET